MKKLLIISIVLSTLIFNTNGICKANDSTETLGPEKHPIEKKIDKCIQECNYATACTAGCINSFENEWLKEIDKNIAKLKKIMTKENYEKLLKSQKEWLEYKQAQNDLYDNTLGTMSGSMYLVILAGNRDEILSRRAKDLENLYNFYIDK